MTDDPWIYEDKTLPLRTRLGSLAESWMGYNDTATPEYELVHEAAARIAELEAENAELRADLDRVTDGRAARFEVIEMAAADLPVQGEPKNNQTTIEGEHHVDRER